MTADSPRTPASYGETVKELQDADAALARVVGQARDYEKALREIIETQKGYLTFRGYCDECAGKGCLGHKSETEASAIARAALAGAGVTDTRLSERTAEKTDAEQALCIAADAYVWNPTEETMEALREARGAWQSAVGMWKLAARRAGVTDNERTAEEKQ